MQFEVHHASYGYRHDRRVLSDINFSFDCRGILSILGAKLRDLSAATARERKRF